MDHTYGAREAFQLGMEEELILVEPGSFGLSHTSSEVLPHVDLEPGIGSIIHDTYEAVVELTSPVVRNAEDGARCLSALRERLRATGAECIGAGLHPTGAFGDVVHVPEQRYLEIAETQRGLITRTPTCAVHTHIGMPDPETAVVALNRMRTYLPVLQGLAANSPYWHSIDSGFATARAQMFRAFPRAEIPREFRDWEDFTSAIDEIVHMGGVPDYTFLWWDIRLHPRLGTLEVRAMDGQSSSGTIAGLAALVHALAVRCATDEAFPDEDVPSREAIAENSFRAGRDGLDATIWHNGTLRPLRDAVREVLEIARPYARDQGGEDLLEEIERILREGNGADRTRAAFARGGGLDGVLEHLVEETRTPLNGAVA